MKRRHFLSAAPIAAMSAVGAAASISGVEASLSKREQIAHHAEELLRLLTETAPAGTKSINHALVSSGGVICTAFENVEGRKWQNGDRLAEFSLRDGWKEVVGIAR